MSVVIGGRGLSVASSGGGAPARNPYEAIAGLNSFFAPDNPHIVSWRTSGAVFAINSWSSLSRLDFMFPPGVVESWSPTIGAINGSKLGFHFAAASTQGFVQPTNVTDTDIVDDDGSFTVFGIIKTSVASGGARVYGKGEAAASGRRWSLTQSDVGDGRLQFAINGTAGGLPNPVQCRSDAPIADGLLHRVIVIYNPANAPDGTIAMYLNGALQADSATVVVGPLQHTADRTSIGGNAEIGNYWDGWLTDIGSYDHAIVDPAVIAQLDAIMLKRST